MSKKAVVKIGADVKEAKDGINKITEELNKLSKSAQESSFSKLSKSVAAFGTTFKLATDAVKKVNESIKENIELSRKQQQAETQLAAAAKNNPYLTEASVIQLKKYAGELQSISTIGDEELLPMMAQLASAGRTQEEIQNIMSAALNVSANGAMSLESAVKNLNKTFSGLSGELGESVPAIKNLTKEELQNGKAVEVLANQYKGISETVSEQTGGWQKYKNSLGDFKEVLGTGWADLQNSVGNVLSGFFDKITSKMKVAKDKAEEFKASLNLIAENNSDNATTATIQSEIDLLTQQNEKYEQYQKVLTTSKKDFIAGEKEKQAELQKTYDELLDMQQEYVLSNQNINDGVNDIVANAEFLNEEFLKIHPEMLEVEKQLEAQKKAVKNASKEYETLNEECYTLGYTYDTLSKRIESNKTRIEELNPKLKEATEAAKAQAEADEADAKAKEAQKKAEEEAADKLKKRNELREQYNKTLEKTQSQIEARRQLNETITEEEEAQLMLNAATQAYINMYSDPAFDRSQTKSGMWEGEQEQREQIKTLAEKAKVAVEIEDLKKKSDEILAEATKYVSKDSDTKLSDSIKAEIDALQLYMSEQELTTDQYEALTQKKIELEKLFTDVVNKENEERTNKEREHIAQLMADMSQYVDQFANITNGITALVRKNNDQENEEALTALSEQYTNGIISYEEYCEKKKALDKKAAQEEYKLKMWEWTASFLQATANIAQGVAKALAEGGPYAGPILAALIGASGAVQIATITANKPKPPSFATGGIVPGNSYSGDKVQANVNSGEMILNAQQQANLWKMANSATGGGGAVVNMPVTIENNASDAVSASAELSSEGLVIMVNKIVNSQMAAGKYNKSMDIAQSRRRGLEIQ